MTREFDHKNYSSTIKTTNSFNHVQNQLTSKCSNSLSLSLSHLKNCPKPFKMRLSFLPFSIICYAPILGGLHHNKQTIESQYELC